MFYIGMSSINKTNTDPNYIIQIFKIMNLKREQGSIITINSKEKRQRSCTLGQYTALLDEEVGQLAVSRDWV